MAFLCLYPTNVLGTSGNWSKFKLDPRFDWALTAYNTSIGSNSYIYNDKFGFDDKYNATTMTLYKTFLSSGIAIDRLDISVQNANLTLNSLGTLQCNFDLNQSGVSDAIVSFKGFEAEPAEVLADGVLLDNYTYTSASDQLIIESSADNIVLNFPYGDDWGEIAIAIGFLAFIIGIIALALVVVKRRSEQN